MASNAGPTLEHFTLRAFKYDASSRWCTDETLAGEVIRHLRPDPGHLVLDLASGTGLVSETLRPYVRRIVGVDLTPAMMAQGRGKSHHQVLGDAERLPLRSDAFDLAVCRQGIQFMDAGAAVTEMVRSLAPGGRICLINLCAYGEEDKDEYFEVLRLRNPARRNFFLREDLARLLGDAGCVEVTVHDYVSVEDVDAWADNGAIDEEARQGIQRIYEHGSEAFLRLHAVRASGERLIDSMLFGIAVGTKPSA